MTASNITYPKKLYVIHHSHTDIGYTELQNTIERWHADFIRQAMAITGKCQSDPKIKSQFKWNCESFWAVEKFIEQASPEEISRLKNLLRSGNIGLSGSYLNLSELLDYDTLYKTIKRAADFGDSIGLPVDSAMTADINGYSWGFSQALHDNGVKNLFTCIHTHHGMFPLGKRHAPFWWETPKGNTILVWNGEHYHYGNELGLVPAAVSSYIIKDECDADMIYNDHWSVAKIRIPRLFENLAKAGYPYGFVPVMASGLRSDNAPPNARIIDFIERWNREFGDRYQVEMITLSEYFTILRKQPVDIPTYRGDWPDWWSDGTASQPKFTKIFRQAQRNLRYYNYLLKNYPDLLRQNTNQVEYALALYSEHTFGHAGSMQQPWNFLHHNIESRKQAYAVTAYEESRRLLDDSFGTLGETDLKTDIPLCYKIINPLDRDVRGIARLIVKDFEYYELKLDKGAEVRSKDSDISLAYQTAPTEMGLAYCTYVELSAGEEIILEILPVQSLASAEGYRPNKSTNDSVSIETPFTKIDWRIGQGIISWYDKISKRELIRENSGHAPFTPVYEITPVDDISRICAVRGEMGLNRKGRDVRRSFGRLVDVQSIEKGDTLIRAILNYSIEGMSNYQVDLKAYANEPRVDIAVRFNKHNNWEPENVYLALPFTTGDDKPELWLEKSGAIIRPRIDQLPETLIDYYSIQEGLAVVSENHGLTIATPDTNLIQLGDLEYGTRKLHDPDNPNPDNAHLYVWLMTNYWETNFAAGLGGFFEFRFSIVSDSNLNDAKKAIQLCRDINSGIQCFRLGKP
ncbi:MAG: glycoside hydrolase [candidate division Zixibacteria bacterium]|nr:glycoside hydrolase [candidate division Zixibacteria bacterium]